mgnify:CR=1 FL=1
MKQSMTQEERYQMMMDTPIPRLISKLAVPTIISMLVTAIYNMADTFFVSRIGTSASGAVGIIASLMFLIQAIGFTFGMGTTFPVPWGIRMGMRREKQRQPRFSVYF